MKSYNFLIILILVFFNSCNSGHSPRNWAIGTSTSILHDFSLDEFFELKKYEVNYIELNTAILLTKSHVQKETWCMEFKSKIDKAGLELWSIHLPYSREVDISLTDSLSRYNSIQEIIDMAKICQILNPKKYIIHASSEPIDDPEREQRILNSIASLKIINEEVKNLGGQLTVECLPRTCLGNTSSELLRIVNAVGNGTGICFDSNHILKEKPEEFIAKTGHLISTVHMSDYDGIDEKHWLPGKGVINWSNVISGLVKSGYQGPFLYEVSRINDVSVSIKDLSDGWDQLKNEYLEMEN